MSIRYLTRLTRFREKRIILKTWGSVILNFRYRAAKVKFLQNLK